jgi:hypothetical protein
MRNVTRGGLVLSVSLLALTAAGCVDRDVSGDQVAYGYSWWVPVVVMLVALGALPLGLLTVRRSARFGWAMFILSPVLAIVVFPNMILDGVKVDSDHFEARYGFWLAPSKPSVRFDELLELRHVTWKERGRRGRVTTKHKLLCIHKGGGKESVTLGDLLKRAEPDIVARAEAKGVAVTAEGP